MRFRTPFPSKSAPSQSHLVHPKAPGVKFVKATESERTSVPLFAQRSPDEQKVQHYCPHAEIRSKGRNCNTINQAGYLVAKMRRRSSTSSERLQRRKEQISAVTRHITTTVHRVQQSSRTHPHIESQRIKTRALTSSVLHKIPFIYLFFSFQPPARSADGGDGELRSTLFVFVFSTCRRCLTTTTATVADRHSH